MPPKAESDAGAQHEEEARERREAMRQNFMSEFPFTMFFVVWWAAFLPNVWPYCGDFAEWALPQLRDAPLIPELQAIMDPTKEVKPPEKAFDNVKAIQDLSSTTQTRQTSLQDRDTKFSQEIDRILAELKSQVEEMDKFDSLLDAADSQLSQLDEDISSTTWQTARQSAQHVGLTLLDTTKVQVWPVADPKTCSRGVSTADFETVERELTEKATATASLLKEAPEAVASVRQWVKGQIDQALSGNESASQAIADLTSSASSPVA